MSLRNIVSKKTVSYLNPREDMSQFQRTRSLSDGLGQAVEAFNFAFTKTARGMGRSHWAENSDRLVEVRFKFIPTFAISISMGIGAQTGSAD